MGGGPCQGRKSSHGMEVDCHLEYCRREARVFLMMMYGMVVDLVAARRLVVGIERVDRDCSTRETKMGLVLGHHVFPSHL